MFFKAEQLKPYLPLGANLDTIDTEAPTPLEGESSDEENGLEEDQLEHIYLMHDKFGRSACWWKDIEVTPPPESEMH